MSDGYVPVEPTTGLVHKFSNPNSPSDERTVCGKRIPWVRTEAWLKPMAPYCIPCHTEDGEVAE